jgi:hypothetical protein
MQENTMPKDKQEQDFTAKFAQVSGGVYYGDQVFPVTSQILPRNQRLIEFVNNLYLNLPVLWEQYLQLWAGWDQLPQAQRDLDQFSFSVLPKVIRLDHIGDKIVEIDNSPTGLFWVDSLQRSHGHHENETLNYLFRTLVHPRPYFVQRFRNGYTQEATEFMRLVWQNSDARAITLDELKLYSNLVEFKGKNIEFIYRYFNPYIGCDPKNAHQDERAAIKKFQALESKLLKIWKQGGVEIQLPPNNNTSKIFLAALFEALPFDIQYNLELSDFIPQTHMLWGTGKEVYSFERNYWAAKIGFAPGYEGRSRGVWIGKEQNKASWQNLLERLTESQIPTVMQGSIIHDKLALGFISNGQFIEENRDVLQRTFLLLNPGTGRYVFAGGAFLGGVAGKRGGKISGGNDTVCGLID